MKTIFLYEWYHITRRPVLWCSLCFFSLLGLGGIYNGNVIIRQQLLIIDSLKSAYQVDLANHIRSFTDTTNAVKKVQAKYAGTVAMIDARLPQNTIHYPKSLAALSIGVRDINPFYDKIKKDRQFLEPLSEFSNPSLLYEGNFDFSFVLLFLLPLLVIAWSYDLLSRERENGTYPLLKIQGLSIHRIVIYKMIFRLLLILIVLIILNIIGVILTAKRPAEWKDLVYWFFITITYLFFWQALCYLCVMRSKTSSLSVTSMISAWLLLLIVIPSVGNTFIEMKHPVPLRADLAEYERHVDWKVWFTRPKLLIDTFNERHPEYLQTFVPQKDTNNQSQRFFAAYFETKERQVLPYVQKLDEEIMSGNRVAAIFTNYVPVLKTQQLLNMIAGTGLTDSRLFREQTSAFQQKWKKFMYDAQFQGKIFTPADFQMFPVFIESQQSANGTTIVYGGIVLWLYIGLFLILGYKRNI